MARKSQAASAEECCAKCERDIAALRKEVAALKAALSKKSTSGDDPRVDKIWAAIVRMGKEKFLK
jgi:hypothetical protein